MWIDSHCHLQLDDADPAELIDRARARDVVAMVCVGTDLITSTQAVELAATHDDVFAVVGLHPHEASRLTDEWPGIEDLITADGVVGIGEAGFDLHYEHSPRADQERAFRRQIRAALERSLPLVIHSREAWDETFAVLEAEGVPEGTVFHCFTGGPSEAERAVAMGALLSFSGIVSFRNAAELRAAAAGVPDERLLVETDAPYLAPVPHRGSPNEPAYVSDVGAALAGARGEPVGVVAGITRRNAIRVFGLGSRFDD